MKSMDEIETSAIRFTLDHLTEVSAESCGPDAMLYAGTMAGTVCEFIRRRYGAKAAYELMQSLADHVIENQPPSSPPGSTAA